MQGINELFEGKKRIYRYEDLNFSILNAPLNEVEIDQFQSAIQVLSQFEGMPQFEGIQEIIGQNTGSQEIFLIHDNCTCDGD